MKVRKLVLNNRMLAALIGSVVEGMTRRRVSALMLVTLGLWMPWPVDAATGGVSSPERPVFRSRRDTVSVVIPDFRKYGTVNYTVRRLPAPSGVLDRIEATITPVDDPFADRTIRLDFLAVDARNGTVQANIWIDGRRNRFVYDVVRDLLVSWGGPDDPAGQGAAQAIITTQKITLCKAAQYFSCGVEGSLFGFATGPLGGYLAGTSCWALWTASGACG